jgi:hypothetical protein
MLQEIMASEWFWYALAGFGTNGFITQAVALTPTKKDDSALSMIGVVIKALTGTFGMSKSSK